MVKRKEADEGVEIDDNEEIKVDFDFFDIVEDDFLSLKSLFRQLLGIDNVFFNLSELTQLLVEAKVGTTVKADDKEYNDVLAVLSIIDFDSQNGETAKLLQYWIERNNSSPEILRALHRLSVPNGPKIGLVMSERFLNMPFEVVPPLYNVLVQEYQSKSLDYDYLLIPSRVYAERESSVDDTVPNSKRGTGNQEEYHQFHVEDAVIEPETIASSRFTFKTPVDETDSRRAFQDLGIHPYGHISVLDARKLTNVSEAVSKLMG